MKTLIIFILLSLLGRSFDYNLDSLLDTYVLNIRVLNKDGTPSANAFVRVDGPSFQRCTNTNSSGIVKVVVDLPGTYYVCSNSNTHGAPTTTLNVVYGTWWYDVTLYLIQPGMACQNCSQEGIEK